MSTEKQGPYFIEWQQGILVVRAKQPFSAVFMQEMKAHQDASIFSLPPLNMHRGTRIILSMQGYSDIILKLEGEA